MGLPIVEWTPATAEDVSVQGLPLGAPPADTWEIDSNGVALSIIAEEAAPVIGRTYQKVLRWNAGVPAASTIKWADILASGSTPDHGAGVYFARCWAKGSASATISLQGSGDTLHSYTRTGIGSGWGSLHVAGVVAASIEEIEVKISGTPGGASPMRVVGLQVGRCLDFERMVEMAMPPTRRSRSSESAAGVTQTDTFGTGRSLFVQSNDESRTLMRNAEDLWEDHAADGEIFAFANDRHDRAINWLENAVIGQDGDMLQWPRGGERYRIQIIGRKQVVV